MTFYPPIIPSEYCQINRLTGRLETHSDKTLTKRVTRKTKKLACTKLLNNSLKWLKMILNYPPWLEKILKFTTLKLLKMILNIRIFSPSQPIFSKFPDFSRFSQIFSRKDHFSRKLATLKEGEGGA